MSVKVRRTYQDKTILEFTPSPNNTAIIFSNCYLKKDGWNVKAKMMTAREILGK